ncbi:thiamine pyrophosphate-dependent dehydrogenase E1 component subunit alpha [Actinokineospora sp. PR83]|uniref:thiamine pyrophosphate-dependent dehydrogenase E1 component subunit alpha n=1 Tax=Actinokineospora sp. PR83 TaxID=2884908 RepID=UPI001F19F33C|nr:thiamine pyrophosphate-dependent dehydrogenase E1 component subunit alpha [Actinokineospora sp. PR83]MCG8918355.1 thiamine pyrophosphate-dependent dehydrogenase E1 component subunit alpha [Actinokineospora sp. PR83]
MTSTPDTAMVRDMVRIRKVEEVLADYYRDEQQMRTPTHFSIGQEATSVGVCAALRRTDPVYTGHRSHAPYLAKGGDLRGLVDELHGRETGCAKGRGGSIHLVDHAVGFAGSAAILGEMIPVAAGAAWAFALTGAPRVATTFFGDGATEEGVFAETMNFAAVHRLPALFVCENNTYSISSPLAQRQAAGFGIAARAAAHGVHAVSVDGNDVFAVRAAATAAVDRARAGEGPVLLELHTYRWREHVGPGWDHDHGYRTREEIDSWIERCPIRRAADALRPAHPDIDDLVAAWSAEYTAEAHDAVRLAKAAPWPDVADLTRGAYGPAA